MIANVVSGLLLLGGAVLALLGVIGLHRFDDVYSRMHAATKPATLGVVMVLAAAALQAESGSDVAKLVLVGAFQLITAPVAAHMLGRAARADAHRMRAVAPAESPHDDPDLGPDHDPDLGPGLNPA